MRQHDDQYSARQAALRHDQEGERHQNGCDQPEPEVHVRPQARHQQHEPQVQRPIDGKIAYGEHLRQRIGEDDLGRHDPQDVDQAIGHAATQPLQLALDVREDRLAYELAAFLADGDGLVRCEHHAVTLQLPNAIHVHEEALMALNERSGQLGRDIG